MTVAHRHPCSYGLRALFAALLLAAPGMPARVPAEASRADRPASPALEQRPRTASATPRFSDLAEVTAANVGGLLPLVARSVAVTRADPLSDSSPAIDPPLQRFVEERTMAVDGLVRQRSRTDRHRAESAVSYLVGGGGEDRTVPAVARTELGELRAWDPIERQVLWSVHEALPISSGTLVTAGGLVFYGSGDGWFKALDARTGRLLWKHWVDGRRLDQPASYRGADGHQYIAVRALARTAGAGGETVLLFALAH